MTESDRPEPATCEWTLYILECTGGRLYTGITLDLEARYKAHASGKGARFTRSYPPERIVFTHRFSSRSEALKAEYAIKQKSAGEKRCMIRNAGLTEQPE